ncbi:uncharacterized protein LOC128240503 [Mya arenaria]|uniref:uncharacterized protein LOC128240503 n=1 Tax=Mya arenaria TaxID=6604 RepID=UPI0022E5C2EB|nr:uncharacterized protein LOC128240503 [Mya arenaria]
MRKNCMCHKRCDTSFTTSRSPCYNDSYQIHSDDDVPPKPVIKRSKSQRTSESVATLKNTEASTGSEVKNGLRDKAKLIDEEEVEVEMLSGAFMHNMQEPLD